MKCIKRCVVKGETVTLKICNDKEMDLNGGYMYDIGLNGDTEFMADGLDEALDMYESVKYACRAV